MHRPQHAGEILKGTFHSENALNVSVHTLSWRNLRTRQSPVILNLCLRITRPGKSQEYCEAIVFEKLRFQNVFSPH